MRRTLVIGDIHGHFAALQKVLALADYEMNHDRLICLGDYVDGWPQSFEVVDFLLTCQNQPLFNNIYLKGNHDHMFASTLTRLLAGESKERLLNELPIHHRAELIASIESYQAQSEINQQRHLKSFFQSLSLYHIEADCLFVHAGFNLELGVEITAQRNSMTLMTDRTLYGYANMKYKAQPDLKLGGFQEIFIGHTPTLRDGEVEPIKKCNVINLDQGCKMGGRLTVWELESHEYWQVEV